MKIQFMFLLLISLTTTATADHRLPPTDLCNNPPEPTEKMPTFNLPENYKISGTFIDWDSYQSFYLQETVTNGFRALEMKIENGYKWVEDLKSGETLLVTEKKQECTTVENADRKTLLPLSVLGGDLPSIQQVMWAIQFYSFGNKGFILNDAWVFCGNGSFVEVKLDEFSNPPMLKSIRGFNSFAISKHEIKHITITFDQYEEPLGNEFSIPNGVVCMKRNETELKPKPMEEFAGILTYQNHKDDTTDVVEMLYSKSQKLFILSGGNFKNILGLVYPPQIDYILHDFKHGYEFVLSQGACGTFEKLPFNSNDVLIDYQQYHDQLPLEYVLIPSYMRWSEYKNGDQEFIDLRALDSLNNQYWELVLTQEREILSYSTYDFWTHEPLISMNIHRIPMEKSSLNVNSVQTSNCYDDGHDGNNTWIVDIKNKTLMDVGRIGLARLNQAVVESVSKNVHTVIPYRVVVAFVQNHDNGLSMIFRLIEKTSKGPARVHGYLLKDELATEELIRKIVAAGNLKIEIDMGDDEEKEIWTADVKSMKPFPPAHPVVSTLHEQPPSIKESAPGAKSNGKSLNYKLLAFIIACAFVLLVLGVFIARREQKSQFEYQDFEPFPTKNRY